MAPKTGVFAFWPLQEKLADPALTCSSVILGGSWPRFPQGTACAVEVCVDFPQGSACAKCVLCFAKVIVWAVL